MQTNNNNTSVNSCQFLLRADLWAYAAKVAVEYTTEDNNFMCQGQPNDWSGSLVNHGKYKDCLRNAGEDDCEVNMIFRCGSNSSKNH